jgi:hypothetical protein
VQLVTEAMFTDGCLRSVVESNAALCTNKLTSMPGAFLPDSGARPDRPLPFPLRSYRASPPRVSTIGRRVNGLHLIRQKRLGKINDGHISVRRAAATLAGDTHANVARSCHLKKVIAASLFRVCMPLHVDSPAVRAAVDARARRAAEQSTRRPSSSPMRKLCKLVHIDTAAPCVLRILAYYRILLNLGNP